MHQPLRRALFGGCLAGLLFAGAPSRAQEECACLWEGSFADVQADTDLVVAGRVIEIKGNAVDLAVEEKLRGDVYLDKIRIWMRTKAYCRPEAGEFPEGSRWVMALKRIGEVPEDGFDPATPNLSYGRRGDYYLPSCGGYWLRYQGEAVTGNLVDAPRWAREPDMRPVLLELLAAYLRGDTDRAALKEATREDPALDALMLDTRAFLRGDDEVLDDR